MGTKGKRKGSKRPRTAGPAGGSSGDDEEGGGGRVAGAGEESGEEWGWPEGAEAEAIVARSRDGSKVRAGPPDAPALPPALPPALLFATGAACAGPPAPHRLAHSALSSPPDPRHRIPTCPSPPTCTCQLSLW